MKNTTKITVLFILATLILVRIYSGQIKQWFSDIRGQNIEVLPGSIEEQLVNSDGGRLQTLNFQSVIATTTIRVSDCLFDPKTVAVKYGEDIYFKNIGNLQVSLDFPKIPDLSILPGITQSVDSTSLISSDRKIGSMSVVAYHCKGKNDKTGYIRILD